jgi:hypothetical protein
LGRQAGLLKRQPKIVGAIQFPRQVEQQIAVKPESLLWASGRHSKPALRA